ncbi:MAG: ATP-grasp domain-containing protein [Longimicrobiales bacterium]
MRVLVLDGNENQAVAATRSLGRAGYHVTVGADTSWSKAGWSRHASESAAYPSPRDDAPAFVDAIERYVARHKGTFVLPMTERTTLPLSAHRDRLINSGARFVLPAHSAVLRAFDKEAVRWIATDLGIAVPETRVVCDAAQARAAAESVGFPVVLKPRVSEEVGPHGGPRPTGAPRYASSLSEVENAFADLSERCSDVLVQSFVEGSGAGYFALLREGEVRAEFAHRRIRDVRPTGSGSAVRESVPVDAALRNAGLRILEALEWHGVAMVEFRRRADGSLVLLEVNGRFWNSLALAVHAGVDFPRMLAEIAFHGDVQPLALYRTGIRCRWILGDVRHLVAVMAGPPRGYPGQFPHRWRTLLDVLAPRAGMRHDNFELADPLPGFGDVLDFAFRRVPATLAKRRQARP